MLRKATDGGGQNIMEWCEQYNQAMKEISVEDKIKIKIFIGFNQPDGEKIDLSIYYRLRDLM